MRAGARLDYGQRVNRVIDHIHDHLADDLALEDLARIAAFSPFHFHRVFKAIVGETLFGFIQRTRIERAGGAERWRRRNLGQQVRNRGKAPRRGRRDTPRKRREENAMTVQIRTLPTFHVAYMRYVGPFGPHGIPELWGRLRQWMERRDPRQRVRARRPRVPRAVPR